MAFDLAGRPPVAAWPAAILEHEPAHGLFQRIALANHHASIRTFAGAVGVNGRNIDLDEILAFCQGLPIAGIDRLADTSPRLDGKYVVLCGQRFRRDEWSINRPRVCAGCIEESRHARNWFALTILRHCPIHNEPLVDNVDGVALEAWYADVGATPDGSRVRSALTEISPSCGQSLERYVLGRMGVVEGFRIPLLDDCEMFEVIEAATTLGFATMRSPASGPSRGFARSPQNRAAAAAAGFALLRGGAAVLEDFLRKFVSQNPDSSAHGLHQVYGWLYGRAYALSNEKLNRHMRVAMTRAIPGHDRYHRRRSGTPRAADAPLRLFELAAHLELSPEQALKLATGLGYAEPTGERQVAYSFPRAVADQIAAAAQSLLTREMAAQALGMTVHKFDRLCRQDGIRPVMRRGGSSAAFDQFLPADVQVLAKRRLVSQAKVGRAVPTDNGLTLAAAAALLGAKTRVVSALLDASFLERLSERAVGRHLRLSDESVSRFRSIYARAGVYSSVLGCPSHRVPMVLRRHGIEPIGLGRRNCGTFYERAQVRRALGLASDPDCQPLSSNELLLRTIRDVLVNRGSSVNITTIAGDCASVVNVDRNPIVHLTVDQEAQHLKLILQADKARSPRRFSILTSRLDALIETWPEAMLAETGEDGRFCVSETVSLNAADDVENVLDWLENRMAAIRSVFGTKATIGRWWSTL